MVDVAGPEAPEMSNPEVVECLEMLLGHARKGAMTHLSFVYVEAPDNVFAGTFGSLAYQDEVHQAFDELRNKIDDHCDAQINPYDPSISADHVCYSLSRGVLNFDFLAWLVTAEMRRIREGAPAPLKIALYRNSRSMFTDFHNSLCNNIIFPLSQMLGQPSEVMGGYGYFPLTYYEVTAACRRGEKVPHLKLNMDVAHSVGRELQGNRPVTITLRETKHFPHRNSNLDAWLKFADYLKKNGEQVIIVRDTDRADEGIDGHSTFPAASKNLHTRLALYQQAKINFGVANGPMTLCFHGEAPFRFFSELDPLHLKRYKPCWPEWWPKFMGINAAKGEQFPWFHDEQKIVWKRDDFNNLVEAYESLGV